MPGAEAPARLPDDALYAGLCRGARLQEGGEGPGKPRAREPQPVGSPRSLRRYPTIRTVVVFLACEPSSGQPAGQDHAHSDRGVLAGRVLVWSAEG